MTISQFSTDVDDLLKNINALYLKSSSPDFDAQKYAQQVAQLQKSLDDIKPVVTKDAQGNALTDEDGIKIFSASDLLELDRQEHLKEVAKQKLLLLKDLTSPNATKQTIEDIHKAYNNQQAKEEFFAGRGTQLGERLDATKTADDNTALMYGPLNKNMYTDQLETLVKGMIRGQEFTLSQNSEKEHIVRMGGKEYNLTQILKHANLSHLTFDKQDCEQYLNMLANKPMAYKPDVDQSDAATVAIARGKINADKTLPPEEKKRKINELVDGVLLQNIDKANKEKPEGERDYSLAQISPGERLAINIWTTGFYDCANPFLRGDVEGAFERTRAMSELVGGCKLCLMSELPASGPEPGKLYVGKNASGELTYTVLTPQKTIEKDQVLTGITVPSGDLTMDTLNKNKEAILAQSTKKGHTAIKEKGREDALRELLCTTAFVVHGAAYKSPGQVVAPQVVYRGDDALYDPVLQQRLKAADTKGVVSLSGITSTAQENPNVDFAFSSKPENKDKVKVGSIHDSMGKDISAISAFKREKEFLSISRHKQYEGVLKTGENEYLFKVRDVAALNQLSPEELVTSQDMAKINKAEKSLQKQEKGILAKVSKSKRQEIESKQKINELRKAEVLDSKKAYLEEVERLSKINIDDEVAHKKEEPAVQEAAAQQKTKKSKRKRAESFGERMQNYAAQKMRQMWDIVAPQSAPTTPTQTSHAPVKEHVAPPKVQDDAPSNPLMLPPAQAQYLRKLETEMAEISREPQVQLKNSSGGIEHLMIRQFQVDTQKEVAAHKTVAKTEVIENKEKTEHMKLR